ncbi:lytic transglycosylase domain-containing protein [Acinetobacter sp. ANC 3781]
MSNWLSGYSGEDQRQVDEVNAKGIAHKPTQQKKEPGLFDGAGSAIPRGALAGAVKVVDAVAKPFERVADHIGYSVNDTLNGGLDGALDVREPSFSEIHADKNKERQNKLVMEVEQLEDKENTGLIGNIAFGVSDFATRALGGSLVAGPAGAVAATGLSETNYSYEDLTHKGVDSGTAAKVAVIDGVVAGASAALPINYGFKGTGGLVKDAALSIGGATALSTGGQALSGEILKSEDYNKQAKKYEVTAESVTTELVLNGLLFGAGRYAQGLNKDIDAELHNIDVDALETRNTQIQSALVLNEMQLEDAAAPVKPSNPIQHNNHLKNMNGAVESLKAGRPVNVVHPVKGEEKQKPVNYDSMALPTNAKTIARKAQQEGVDPSVALTIAHLESNFSHTAQPPVGKDGKRLSTAYGLFQPLAKTWKGLGGGDKNNIDEQIRIGLKHIKQADSYMRRSLGREPVAHEQYLGHLLGPGGAAAVLKADPNAKLIDIVRKYDSKNADAIVNNNGMSGMSVGQAIDKWRKKWNTVSARYGGNGTSHAIGMDGSSYDMAYEVKSLDELIASNDAAYGVNPNYPSELQPRDRTREASRQQIENMANDLRPELLGESYKLSDGAPIIGMDNVVESGNGRTLAIGKAYENGRAEEYRAYIEEYANTRGWDISGINNPVLVRTRLTDTDRVQFAKLANESDVAQFSASERASSDVDRLPDSSLLKINSDGNINLEQSMDFVRGFVNSLPKSEHGSVITAE